MNGAIVKNSDDFRRNSEFGMENGLAAIVRRRWPLNPVDQIAREWGLSDGQARGVLYATASRSTLNKILKHKRGGLSLWLEIIAEVTGERLETYIEKQAERARDERRRWEAEERAATARLARLAECREFSRRGSNAPR